MARCYYLEYKSKGFFSSFDNDSYYCKLCGKEFRTNDSYVKNVCDAKSGEEYRKCTVYKTKR